MTQRASHKPQLPALGLNCLTFMSGLILMFFITEHLDTYRRYRAAWLLLRSTSQAKPFQPKSSLIILRASLSQTQNLSYCYCELTKSFFHLLLLCCSLGHLFHSAGTLIRWSSIHHPHWILFSSPPLCSSSYRSHWLIFFVWLAELEAQLFVWILTSLSVL